MPGCHKLKRLALLFVQIFSLRGIDFPCGPHLDCFGALLRVQQWLFKLQSEKKVLPIWRAPQNGGMEKGNRSRQLRLVDQSYWNFQRNLGTGFQIATRGQQEPSRREVQRSGKFKKFLAPGFSPADKKRDRYRQPVPAAPFGGCVSTHVGLLPAD